MATPSKRTRRTKSAGSPEPMGIASMNPPCGHSVCGPICSVRYVGPTSPLHNHHIMHAARGASQVWTAAIVAGLAVVLTGAIAYTTVQAAEVKEDPMYLMLRSLHRIEMRLDRMEPRLNRISGGEGVGSPQEGMGNGKVMPRPQTATSTMPEMKKQMPPVGTEAKKMMPPEPSKTPTPTPTPVENY